MVASWLPSMNDWFFICFPSHLSFNYLGNQWFVKYNVTSTGWLYTASCPGYMYILFLFCLSLFSSAISLCIVCSSLTLLTVLFFTHSNILFFVLFFSLCISCFRIYHGIRATVVSLFTQAREQHDPQIAQSFMDLERILTQTFHNAWRVVRHTLERSSQETSTRKLSAHMLKRSV